MLWVVSIGDAFLLATTDVVPPWDDETGVTWALVTTNLLMMITFGLLAAVLVRNAERIDGGGGAVRWIRRLFAADLAVLATGYLLISVVGAVLGGVLLRRPDVRMPAALMVAVVPIIGLTFALDVVAPDGGTPAAETSLYLGIALLGLTATGVGTPRTDRAMAGTNR